MRFTRDAFFYLDNMVTLKGIIFCNVQFSVLLCTINMIIIECFSLDE